MYIYLNMSCKPPDLSGILIRRSFRKTHILIWEQVLPINYFEKFEMIRIDFMIRGKNDLGRTFSFSFQVQQNEDSLLHPDEQTHVSPIVSLEPPTTISKFVTITVPCPWLSKNADKGMCVEME